MMIRAIEQEYIENLVTLNDEMAQCDYLITLGMEKPDNAELKTEGYRLGGCKTAIWVQMKEAEGIIFFSAESDSLLVRGVLRMLEAMYHGKRTDEVIKNPPQLIDFISDEVIYPEIKQNGILKCYQMLAALNKKETKGE